MRTSGVGVGAGANSKLVDTGTVVRVCVATDAVEILWMSEGALSDCSRVGCPELRTELGRLALAAGDAAPESFGVADPGLLSPTKLDIRLSSSLRLSARAGVGAASYALHDQLSYMRASRHGYYL